jgi:hypothetical protein
VRRQQIAANQEAEAAYFSSDKPTAEDKAMWVNSGILDGCTLIAINYKRVQTPEARELKSICLAVAAFGGFEAIQLIGYALSEDHDCDIGRSVVWAICDGMAGFVL